MIVKNNHYNQTIELDLITETFRIDPLGSVEVPDKYKKSPLLNKHKEANSITIFEQPKEVKEVAVDKKESK